MAVTAPTRIPAAVRRAASSVASAGSPEPLRMSTVAGAPCSDPSLQPVVGVEVVGVGEGLDVGGAVTVAGGLDDDGVSGGGSCGAVDGGDVLDGGVLGGGGVVCGGCDVVDGGAVTVAGGLDDDGVSGGGSCGAVDGGDVLDGGVLGGGGVVCGGCDVVGGVVVGG